MSGAPEVALVRLLLARNENLVLVVLVATVSVYAA
jgi:membrane protein YqaA with SNARE-associated domain